MGQRDRYSLLADLIHAGLVKIEGLRQICDRHGVPLVFEVITAFGRTGKAFASVKTSRAASKNGPCRIRNRYVN